MVSNFAKRHIFVTMTARDVLDKLHQQDILQFVDLLKLFPQAVFLTWIFCSLNTEAGNCRISEKKT